MSSQFRAKRLNSSSLWIRELGLIDGLLGLGDRLGLGFDAASKPLPFRVIQFFSSVAVATE